MNILEWQQEHDKQNENYVAEKMKILTGIRVSSIKLKKNADTRLDVLCETLDKIETDNFSYVEAIDLFVSFFDDVILECVIYSPRRAEIEEKIINLCAKALEKPTADGTRNFEDEHITAIFCENLKAAPSAESSAKMAAAVLDETNPLRLGFSLYANFCKENPALADTAAMDYLNVETKVRELLVTSTGEIPPIDKLLQLPIDNAEKYLLTSLNFFYNDYKKDAVAALELGLKKFPDSKRLMSAYEGLGGTV